MVTRNPEEVLPPDNHPLCGSRLPRRQFLSGIGGMATLTASSLLLGHHLEASAGSLNYGRIDVHSHCAPPRGSASSAPRKRSAFWGTPTSWARSRIGHPQNRSGRWIGQPLPPPLCRLRLRVCGSETTNLPWMQRATSRANATTTVRRGLPRAFWTVRAVAIARRGVKPPRNRVRIRHAAGGRLWIAVALRPDIR